METQFSRFSTVGDFLDAFRRRKEWLLVPGIIIFCASVIIAFVLPARYESRGVISIEEQSVSQDLVRSTVTSYAAQQVQVISQRVLAWENVEAIVKKLGLYNYNEELNTEVNPSKVREFRDNVSVDLVTADVIDPRTGRPTQATIAFTVSYNDPVPVVAKDVAVELVELFLQENVRDRAEQAASTEQFLSSESNRLKEELAELEQKMAQFKEQNEGSMPGSYNYNLSTVQGAQKELSDLDVRVEVLSKRRIEIAGQMSQINPTAPTVLSSGDIVMSDTDRLKALQTEYRQKQAVYRENHPDLIRLKREIAGLQAKTGVGSDVNDLYQQLEDQEQLVAELEGRYRDDHHELIQARRVLEQIRESARASQRNSTPSIAPVADNPAYVMLQTQLDSVDAELSSILGRKDRLNSKIREYEELLRRAPEVEREFQAMLRDHKSVNTEYIDIQAKKRNAVLAKNLEQEQKGERFELIQTPLLPSSPVSPNRPAIMFLGAVLALALGMGLAILREITDSAIHGVNQLTEVLGQAPLVAIPYIDNDVDIMHQRRNAAILVGAVLLVLAATFVLMKALVAA